MTHLPPDDGRHNDSDRELRVLTELFDAVAPSSRAEAEEELLSTGVDPQRVGQRLDLLAKRALAGLAGPHPIDGGAQKPREAHDAATGVPPAHSRIRPLYLWATAAALLLGLAGLHLLRSGAPDTTPRRAASPAVSGSRVDQERPALRMRPPEALDDVEQRAAGATQGQAESARPPHTHDDRGTAVTDNPRSGAMTSDVPAPAQGSLGSAVAEDLLAAVVQNAQRFHDTTQQLQMTDEQAGSAQVTHLQLQTKTFEGGAFKAVIHFEPPPEREVVALLLEWATEEASNAPTVVPLRALAFIPNLRGVRRLTSSNCTLTPDLNCLDLLIPGQFLPWAVANWNARSVERAPSAAVVIDLTPRPDSGDPLLPDYRRLRIRLQADATLREVEFYDQRDTPARTLLLTDFRSIDGVPVAHRLEVMNVRTASRTVLELVGFRHDENLSDDVFTIAHIINEWH